MQHSTDFKTHKYHCALLRTMDMYKCTKCGYIYNPGSGDASQNIPPKTPFEKLPETWLCPRCGATKKVFVAVS